MFTMFSDNDYQVDVWRIGSLGNLVIMAESTRVGSDDHAVVELTPEQATALRDELTRMLEGK